MGLTDMAWGSLRRAAGRTVFLLLVIVFSVTTLTVMFSVTGAMRTEIGDAFDQTGANILVLPQASRRFSYAGLALPATSVREQYLPEVSAETVRSIKNRESIAIVAPKLLAIVETPQGRATAVGVRFPAELRLKKWWRIRVSRATLLHGESMPARQTDYAPAYPPLGVGPTQVLLGAQVAGRWQKDVGDTVRLNGRAFEVAGVIDPVGSDEDRAIWVDLRVLQELTGNTGRVSLIEVAALCNTCPIEEIVKQVAEKLPGSRVTAIKEAVEARRAVVDRFGHFALALAVTAGMLGALAVALVLLGSVRDRTRDIGIMRALGFRQGHILALVYLEAGTLGLAGGLLGSFLGNVLARVLGPSLAGMRVAISLDPLLFAVGVGGAVLLSLLAGTVPAWQAARIDAVRALRFL
ncbi:MAG: FtsX-like permease family protein [Bacillota bacterium]